MMERGLAALLLAGTTLWSASALSAHAQTSVAAAGAATPSVISLDEAIRRAEANEATFASVQADSRSAQLDRSIARAGLLPTAIMHNQYLYTQGNGALIGPGQSTTTPRFIANNAVHEYISQGVATETIGLAQFSAVSLADANAARAAAELEVARRGLLTTVVALYYSVAASESKLQSAQRALDEANGFAKLTGQREEAREAAHADVLKAQLQQQQRVRDVADAQLAASRAHLELGVLLFPDPRTEFTTEMAAPSVLPDRADVDAAAGSNNPELKSALASVKASDAAVLSARAAYLPDLGLNVGYGIDAAQFAVNGPNNTHNLGYSASATVDIPLWDWLATQHKVKQSEIRRDAAKVALTATQRHLIAALAEYYDEAASARDQLASLELSATTAAESLRLTKMRYLGGEGTVLEVVDAQNSLILAEDARADGMVRYETALANLQTLTGRF